VDKSALSWDHHEQLNKHESQVFNWTITKDNFLLLVCTRVGEVVFWITYSIDIIFITLLILQLSQCNLLVQIHKVTNGWITIFSGFHLFLRKSLSCKIAVHIFCCKKPIFSPIL
jgi:hypothetical protein